MAHLLTDAPEPVTRQRVTSEKDSDRRRRWWSGIKDQAINNLGGACTGCGFSDRRILQLDHITPIQASRRDYRRKQDWQRAARGILDNLQLLCPNCHALKTASETREYSWPIS